MKKIIIEISALVFFVMAIFMLLEFLFRDYKNAVDKVMDDFFLDRDSAKVLMVGNSHTLPFYKALKHEAGSGVACLSIGGDDLFWMQALVKKQLKSMPAVQYVILNCDDELLGFNQSLSGLNYMNRMLYPYTDEMYGNKQMDILLSKSNFFRSNRDFGYLFSKQSNADMMIANAGGKGTFTDEECKSRAKEISEKRFQTKLFSENISYILSIIDEVKKGKKKLFILKLPKCDCLASSVNIENLGNSRKLLDSVFTATHTEMLDFSGDSTFKRNAFANPDHLTPQAARMLMEKINDRIFASEGVRPIHLVQKQVD
ncbi:hypothetical protein BH11BAC1_BH11BAC1_19180 [soil metagenome]